ncbi:serine/threonine-protein kinase Nek3 [Condylostylus longicornis]|uniref:serine/threonine-protein kinase Nek3 n=1 Tax=Condylostylus longicornis TaxID=2530218 RepID=UPI00244E010D|nr:serine/threonine-protein kinase Nek3 [Condylostylus longicornis]
MKSLDDYEVVSIIGNGSFGTCFKVKDKITNKIYAWKAINYDDDFEESKKEILDTEIGFLQQLKHPNIVQYYDNICNIETKTIFIIMEYCDGGDLQNLIKKCQKEKLKFEEKYIWKVLYQISKALQLCHNKIAEGCILHRDIKPANIFLDKCGNVKLGDFGLARILKRNQQNFAESFVGSPYYMSPEIVKGRKYDKKSDMWAVGCLIYEMCCLKPPFRGNRFEQLSENISNGQFNSIPKSYSKDLQEIISFILEVDSEQRPNVEIILRHPVFIRNLNDLKADFPKLLQQNDDDMIADNNQYGVKKLIFSPITDKKQNSTNDFSFDELNKTNNFIVSNQEITDISTTQLRAELFGSPIKKISPRTSSFPDLTLINNERIYANSIMTSNYNYDIRERYRYDDPKMLTRDIFEEALKQRLETIRAHEMLLKQRENNLMEKEKQLIEHEKRLISLQKDLEEKKHHVEGMLKKVATEKRQLTKRCPKRRTLKTLETSYCSIELNESVITPTVAKLEISSMPPPLGMLRNNHRKSVTFSSPKQIVKINKENILQLQPIRDAKNNNFHSSHSSKTSTESENSVNKNSNNKRRSILSLFGLNNSQKNKTNHNNNNNSNSNLNNDFNKSRKETDEKAKTLITKNYNQSKVSENNELEILDKVNSNEITQIWTKENKKAAFDMLAAMNSAADKDFDFQNNCTNFTSSQRNSNLRKTTRDRGTSLNRSSKLRRSAVYLSPNTSGNRILL